MSKHSRNTATLATAHAVTPAPEQTSQQDIRGVLIQIAGGRLLLPNATIAEVVPFCDSMAWPHAVEVALTRRYDLEAFGWRSRRGTG